VKGWSVPVRASVLEAVGRALGVEVAWVVYCGLAREPVDADLAPVDWELIRRAIERGE
jgi:hypothetical protein